MNIAFVDSHSRRNAKMSFLAFLWFRLQFLSAEHNYDEVSPQSVIIVRYL